MAALLGKIEECDASKEEWPQYVERMDRPLLCNQRNRQHSYEVDIPIAVIGSTTYTLVRNLVSTDKPGDKSRHSSPWRNYWCCSHYWCTLTQKLTWCLCVMPPHMEFWYTACQMVLSALSGICFTFTNSSSKKPFTTRKRGFGPCFWCTACSFLSSWAPLRAYHWSSATVGTSTRALTYLSTSVCPHPSLVLVVVSL